MIENIERHSRCKDAKRVLGMVGGEVTIMCKVYGRTVQDCRDCAFSILQRPAYIAKQQSKPTECTKQEILKEIRGKDKEVTNDANMD